MKIIGIAFSILAAIYLMNNFSNGTLEEPPALAIAFFCIGITFLTLGNEKKKGKKSSNHS
ncbi:hypothetical protein [Planococcus maitriensis]|nr:hypothetical protein [Planococcus maitriensis]